MGSSFLTKYTYVDLVITYERGPGKWHVNEVFGSESLFIGFPSLGTLPRSPIHHLGNYAYNVTIAQEVTDLGRGMHEKPPILG